MMATCSVGGRLCQVIVLPSFRPSFAALSRRKRWQFGCEDSLFAVCEMRLRIPLRLIDCQEKAILFFFGSVFARSAWSHLFPCLTSKQLATFSGHVFREIRRQRTSFAIACAQGASLKWQDQGTLDALRPIQPATYDNATCYIGCNNESASVSFMAIENRGILDPPPRGRDT